MVGPPKTFQRRLTSPLGIFALSPSSLDRTVFPVVMLCWSAVLPAAVERLLKHWKTLDKAAGSGNGIFETLRGVLQVRVSEEDAARVSAASHGGGGGGGDDETVDLCQWILSQSLSSQDALSRPFLAARAASAATGAAKSKIARQPQHRRQSLPPDDELTGRVIRAYRSFANAGLFGSIGGGDALLLAAGLWSTVLRLPEGLRPASEHRAKLALRLSIDLGLPTTTGAVTTAPCGAPSGGGDAPNAAASILAGLLDVTTTAEEKPTEGGKGATRGAMFYRRFSEPVHEALLRRGGDSPWPGACRSLVDACLSAGGQKTAAPPGQSQRHHHHHHHHHTLLAAQAFAVLEGVLTHQSERQRVVSVGVSSRTVLMDPGETLRAIVPEFRRLVDDPDWGPPPTVAPGKAGGGTGGGGDHAGGTGRMLRESLRLCHRLLRLAAALESSGVAAKSGSSPTTSPASSSSSSSSPSCFEQLLQMSTVLVAGTLGSSSPAVGAAAKADALTLVPFLRPCLTRKARDYGHAAPRAGRGRSRAGATGGPVRSEEPPTAGAVLLPALEEMVARHFPIEDSREPEEGSEQATAFALLLRGLLGAFVRCGDLDLLELLFGTLAEGRKHLHYRWVLVVCCFVFVF